MSRRHRMPDEDREDPEDDFLPPPLPGSSLSPPQEQIAALEARLAGARTTIDMKDRQIANLKRKLIDLTDRSVSDPIIDVMTVLRDHVRELHQASEQETNPTRKRNFNLQAEAVGQAIAKIRASVQTVRLETHATLNQEIDR